MRTDGRKKNELRPFKITRSFLKYPEGSTLTEIGDTKVICTATIEEKVPPFLRGTKNGWITAEYSMLPRSTETRLIRDSTRGHIGGRTHEIQRFIGRSLRSVVDLSSLKERTIWIDCDVIQADGGTRTASITGAFISMVDALMFLKNEGKIERLPINEYLAAISVGIVNGESYLDLCFEEDSTAEVDMNIVMTSSRKFIEIQGTAEDKPFSRAQMDELINLATQGIIKLIEVQKQILGPIASEIGGSLYNEQEEKFNSGNIQQE